MKKTLLDRLHSIPVRKQYDRASLEWQDYMAEVGLRVDLQGMSWDELRELVPGHSTVEADYRAWRTT